MLMPQLQPQPLPSSPNRKSPQLQPTPQPHSSPPASSSACQPIESQQHQDEHWDSEECADPASLQQLLEQGDQLLEVPCETTVTKSSSDPTSSCQTKKISWKDIQLVQNLIERCLQLYMSQEEVIKTLLKKAMIEPGFTRLVWQKLEEQNLDFFKAYYTRLKLKNQINVFNHLLEQQYQFMKLQIPPKFPLAPMQNVHYLPMGYPVLPQPPLIAGSHQHMVPLACGPSGNPVVDGASFTENFQSSQGNPGIDNLTDISMEPPPVGQSPCIGVSTMSDISLSPASVMSSGPFPFNPTDMSGIGSNLMSLDGSFSTGDSAGATGVGTVQIPADADGSSVRDSLRSLCQLPRNFSLSDLPADLTDEDLGALGCYSGSPFLSPETSAFLRSPDKDDTDEEKMFESIMEPCYPSHEEKGEESI